MLVDEFHHDGALLYAVDRSDVRVIERRQQLRFPLEARHVLGVAGQRGGKRFDSDVAIELRVAGTVDFAHAACTERREDAVGPSLSPGERGMAGSISLAYSGKGSPTSPSAGVTL